MVEILFSFVPFIAIAVVVIVSIAYSESIRPGLDRMRARVRGVCPKCNYDLRGNVSGVCPECGSQSFWTGE